MVEFYLMSGLKGAQMKLTRKEGAELIDVKRPIYKDVLEIHWFDTRYTIVRSGIIQRQAKIFKEGEYIGMVREKLGLMTHFDIHRKAKKVLEIHEHETIIKQEFKLLKQSKQIGVLRPVGIYVPILSNIGKGVEGDYSGITKTEEEMLVMAILAIGV